MIPLAQSTDHAFVLRAALFAARRHADQRRKGKDREPYVNHVIEVAERLAHSSEGNDAVLLAAGFLHDTVEDTETTPRDIETEFGHEVAQLVAEVTDDTALTSAERKRWQVARIALKSRRAQFLTIADKTANVGSLVRSAPADWSRTRIVAYGQWAESVVGQIRGMDATLDAGFLAAMAALQQRFGSTAD
jgi:(p)ppGpp synthase/HD superfamily hydrolase